MFSKEMILAGKAIKTPVVIVKTKSSSGKYCEYSGKLDFIDHQGTSGYEIKFSVSSEKSIMLYPWDYWNGLQTGGFSIAKTDSTYSIKQTSVTLNGKPARHNYGFYYFYDSLPAIYLKKGDIVYVTITQN